MNRQKPTMKLTAYGSCQVYVEGLNNPKPKVIQAEVVDVDGPSTIGNISAQSLNLLKLNWAVAVQSNSKSTSQSPKLFNALGKSYPLIKEYLLKEYQHVFTGIGCFPGPPYHIETNPDVSPVQQPPPTADSSPKKSIPSASPRLQRLLLKMSKYNVEMRYIQGKTNVIADALSRVYCMESPDEGPGIPLLEVDAITHNLHRTSKIL